MLYQMLTHQPQMIGAILRNTPTWVWGLLAVLTALGASQFATRMVALRRLAIMPLAMGALSVWGMSTAFGSSPTFPYALLAWLGVAACSFTALAVTAPPAGTQYDAWTGRFALPGSWAPLVLILGIFLVRYWVNVEVAIQPALARDSQYTLAVAAVYGLFSGIFAGRAARVVKLAWRAPRTLAA